MFFSVCGNRNQMKKIVLVICCIILLLSGCKKEIPVNEEYYEDAQFFMGIIHETYIGQDFLERSKNNPMLADVNKTIEWLAKTEEDKEFYIKIHMILNRLQYGGHNYVDFSTGNAYSSINIETAFGNGYALFMQNQMDEEQFVNNYREILSKMGEASFSMPFITKYINGSYIIVQSEDEAFQPGDLIVEIDGKDVDTFVEENLGLVRFGYDTNLKKAMNKDSFREYALEAPVHEIKVERDGTILKEVAVQMRNTYLGIENEVFAKDISQGVGYIDLPFLTETEMTPFMKAYQSMRNYPYLILDIRGMDGGTISAVERMLSRLLPDGFLTDPGYYIMRNNEYIMNSKGRIWNGNFVKQTEIGSLAIDPDKFATYQVRRTIHASDYAFTGKLYVLCDATSISGAEYLLRNLKGKENITIVGTSSEGAGAVAGRSMIVLPNTGLVVEMENALYCNEDGSLEDETGTIPDVIVEADVDLYRAFLKDESAERYKTSIYDNVFQECMKMIGE